MSRHQELWRQVSALFCGLTLAAVCGFAETGARPMALLQSRYEIRAGDPARVAVSGETLDFLLHARSRRVSIEGLPTSGLVAGPNHARDGILLAASLRTEPGEYHVTLSATSQTGEERRTTLDVVVKPRTTVPSNSTRNPVVLLNGWEMGFAGSCPIAASSSVTFGNLAQYLVGDGVPVVYLFDNCVEDPNEPIEVLGNDLASFLNSIKYDSGAQVPQIDLVAFSMGGLIARSYLAGLQLNGTYLPPAGPLVGKLVLIATPNFGSFVAGNYMSLLGQGTQDAELEPGSSFLWNLATWNQRGDDLRGVDTIAVIGNAGIYVASLSASSGLANAGDGLVSLTSASLGFITQSSPATRIVPYCHVDPGAFLNSSFGSYLCNAAGIANVTGTTHLTGEIVRSFLSGTTAWSSIGTAPASDPYLSKNGAMFAALVAANGAYAADLSAVEWGTVGLQDGGDLGTIFYYDYIFGTGTFPLSLTSRSLGTQTCGVALPLGYTSTERCKLATNIFSVTPLVSGSARVLTAGATVTLNGASFGMQCNGCKVQAVPAGTSTVDTLTVTSWANTAISVKLPAGVTGLLTLQVLASAGSDSIGVMVAAPSTIAVTPASLQFAYTAGGTAPAAQAVQITNSGTGTLSWTAKASDTWLTLSAASGTAPSTPSVSVSPAGLSPGAYNGTIQISAAGASNSPLSVDVTLTIAPASPVLSVAPQALSFQYTVGSALPAAQNLSLSNGGSGTLSWAASADSYWIGLSAASGSTPGTLSISVNPVNVAAGSHTGVVSVTATNAQVGFASIPVTLVVQGNPAPPVVTAVVNAGSYAAAIAPATWISIFGTNLSGSTYSWQAGDFVNGMLPVSLQGVSVTIDGLPAYIDYISPSQINVLAPDDATVGPVQVVVTTAQQPSNAVTVQDGEFSPAFLTFGGTYVAALHADYSPVGAADLLPGTVTTPAQPGETILLYGVGFGPVTPSQPTGQLVTAAAPLANTVSIAIGGQAAQVVYAGLVEAGLYQFNVTVPNLPNGDAAVVANIGGVAAQTGVLLTVQQ